MKKGDLVRHVRNGIQGTVIMTFPSIGQTMVRVNFDGIGPAIVNATALAKV